MPQSNRSAAVSTTAFAFVAFLLPASSRSFAQTTPDQPATAEGAAPPATADEQVHVNGHIFPGAATAQAPSQGSLTQIQPTAVIGQRFIQENVPATSNYDDIIRLTPSAMDIEPNGPGLQQDFGQSIRGLQYTQFSVLFDGVQLPGSPSNLSPQPAAYFVAHDLSGIVVNRGPGPASTVGSATFGGDVELTSRDPSTTTNLLNNLSLIGYAAAAGNGEPLYCVNPGRGLFFNIAAVI